MKNNKVRKNKVRNNKIMTKEAETVTGLIKNILKI